jgi:hypothetical protein
MLLLLLTSILINEQQTYSKYTPMRLKVLQFGMLARPMSLELKVQLTLLKDLTTEHG